jgi:DNA-binding NarL/FixJ family response regulator
VRVGVISPYELARKGLCSLISSCPSCALVLELPNIPEDWEIARKAHPEILLVQTDGSVPDLDSVARLHRLVPKTKILLYVDKPDEEMELRALQAGACGCVSRSIDLNTLLKAFEFIGRGELWISRHAATRAIEKLAQAASPNGATSNELTSREWDILALLATGSRNKEIATALSVSENTVKTHLGAIYRKINVDCRLAATLYYFQHANSNGRIPREPPSNGSRRKPEDVRSDQVEKSPAE